MNMKNIFAVAILVSSVICRLSGDSMSSTIFRNKPPFTEEKFQEIKRDLMRRRSNLQTYLRTVGGDEGTEIELSQLDMWNLIFDECHGVITGVQRLYSSEPAQRWKSRSYVVSQWFDGLDN